MEDGALFWHPERIERIMDYCLALDVAKGKSMACLMSRDGEIILSPKERKHLRSELESLFKEVEAATGGEYCVIMEATGIYHLQPERFFKEKGKEVIVANPLLTSMAKGTLRKTKTDKTDSEMLANAYFTKLYSRSEMTPDYQPLSRLVEFMIAQKGKLKGRLREKCHICFPALEEALPSSSLFSQGTLRLLGKLPHQDLIAKKKPDTIASIMNGGKDGSFRQLAKARKILEISKSGLFPSVGKDSGECHALSYIAKELLRIGASIDEESELLYESVKGVFPFDVWLSFPGIGTKLASYLTCELGDVTRFGNEKKLIAFCGLDPTIVQSGRSINYHGPISKRGNSHARCHLYQAIMMLLREDALRDGGSDIAAYYKKKRSEGKHHYEAVTACATKLLRKMFYRCKDIKAGKQG